MGTVDKLGTAYEDKIICTGYGAHIVTPMIRSTLDKNPNLTKIGAKALVHKALEILFYRDARSFPKYQVATIDEVDGVQIEGPLEVSQKWDLANMIH